MIEDAINYYGDRFWEYFEGCYYNGWVVSNEELIIMACPVLSTAPIEKLMDPSVKFDVADMWYVHFAKGPIKKMIRQIPIDLPLLGYEHSGRLRFLSMNRILNHHG